MASVTWQLLGLKLLVADRQIDRGQTL